ncbi:MAG TPA: fumarate reductase subunit FrdD [Candidatus Binataceae bacterium]|nr:fumarate reductase subunit FrdD [Candidatus Binataceae bacterium]
MSAKRSNEPIVWFLFGLGGFFAAFFLPVHVLFYGLLFPFKALPDPGYGPTLALLRYPLTRIYLGLLLTFCFFHAAHRIRLTLSDVFDMRHLNVVLAFLCYGSAIAGTIILIWQLVVVP